MEIFKLENNQWVKTSVKELQTMYRSTTKDIERTLKSSKGYGHLRNRSDKKRSYIVLTNNPTISTNLWSKEQQIDHLDKWFHENFNKLSEYKPINGRDCVEAYFIMRNSLELGNHINNYDVTFVYRMRMFKHKTYEEKMSNIVEYDYEDGYEDYEDVELKEETDTYQMMLEEITKLTGMTDREIELAIECLSLNAHKARQMSKKWDISQAKHLKNIKTIKSLSDNQVFKDLLQMKIKDLKTKNEI